MTRPLMPKATAVWLVENTVLTFDQIAAFCVLHILEVQAIADEEVAIGMQGLDPIRGGELTMDEIKRCEEDSSARLEMTQAAVDHAKQQKKKKSRYTPVSKRQDRPDAISWLLKNYPELTDAQIGKLVGTTKPTINSVRDRTHWNTANITAQNPVSLGLCSSEELEKAITRARERAGKNPAAAASNTAQPVADAPAPGAQPVSMPPASPEVTPEAPPEVSPEAAPDTSENTEDMTE